MRTGGDAPGFSLGCSEDRRFASIKQLGLGFGG